MPGPDTQVRSEGLDCRARGDEGGTPEARAQGKLPESLLVVHKRQLLQDLDLIEPDEVAATHGGKPRPRMLHFGTRREEVLQMLAMDTSVRRLALLSSVIADFVHSLCAQFLRDMHIMVCRAL